MANRGKRTIELSPGAVYGDLTVITEAAPTYCGKYAKRMALCRCSCGNTVVVRLEYLRSGHTSSCGCKRADSGRAQRVHGLTGTKLYRAWAGMKERCYNANRADYPNYGGRGIAVCEKWLTFEGFLEDMSPSYRAGLTIDRIDNNGNYEPGNCRWVDRATQNLNTRRNKLIAFRGKTRALKEWADALGISYDALQCRLASGWSVERAFVTPLRRRGAHHD